MSLIANTQQQLGVEFRLRGFIKAELFTDEQAAAMYEAGFRWILVGFEAGHPRILENIQKKATRDDNTRCMEIARRHNLKVKALMSLGHPGESEDTIRATRDWLVEVRPDDFDATVITTYPGTPYFDEAVETSSGIWTYTCSKTLRTGFIASRSIIAKSPNTTKALPETILRSCIPMTSRANNSSSCRDWLEADVRAALSLSFSPADPGLRYEHSMGQGALPPYILKTSNPSTARTGTDLLRILPSR